MLLPGFEPEAWLRAVHEHSINFAFAVPTMIYSLLDTPTPQGCDTSSLQTLVYGGAPMTPAGVLEGQERFGSVFQQAYGQTECAGTATSLRRDEHDPNRPERLASCGRAVVGTQVAVLNDDGNEVSPGEVGELCVRGRSVMLGYRNLPDESAAALRGGWLRTGDMARQDDEGYFYVVDRKKDMIISGGFNVYAREVENVLAAHPSVAETAVIGVPDPKWGEAVHAVVITRQGQHVEADELVRFVKAQKGKMFAPKSVEFVTSLPTTPVGKIDKKALREPYWSSEDRRVH